MNNIQYDQIDHSFDWPPFLSLKTKDSGWSFRSSGICALLRCFFLLEPAFPLPPAPADGIHQHRDAGDLIAEVLHKGASRASDSSPGFGVLFKLLWPWRGLLTQGMVWGPGTGGVVAFHLVSTRVRIPTNPKQPMKAQCNKQLGSPEAERAKCWCA